MGLDLLDTPVRVTWDFSADLPGDYDRLAAIAERIREAGVFFTTLQGFPLRQENLSELLTILSGSQCVLTCNGTDQEMQALSQLDGFQGQLLLDITAQVAALKGFDASLISAELVKLRRFGHNPSLAMTPLRENLAFIPALAAFCLDHEVPKFKLPNAHIGDSFHGYSAKALPDWKDLKEFSRLWSETASGFEALPTMEIHDLFLWEIMTPGQRESRSEYGGCQAANSLAHVDINGTVHPCSAWPEPLGVLPDQSFDEIWQDSARQAVCEKIAEVPHGCVGCNDLGVCFGGCRGLAQQLNRSAGERDLMCSGPRQ